MYSFKGLTLRSILHGAVFVEMEKDKKLERTVQYMVSHLPKSRLVRSRTGSLDPSRLLNGARDRENREEHAIIAEPNLQGQLADHEEYDPSWEYASLGQSTLSDAFVEVARTGSDHGDADGSDSEARMAPIEISNEEERLASEYVPNARDLLRTYYRRRHYFAESEVDSETTAYREQEEYDLMLRSGEEARRYRTARSRRGRLDEDESTENRAETNELLEYRTSFVVDPRRSRTGLFDTNGNMILPGPNSSTRRAPPGETTITFDPPLAARYILIKIWSNKGSSGRVDLQNIKVYGFAGMRWVPACEMI